MRLLVPCAACRRHLDAQAAVCPFCAVPRPSSSLRAATLVARAGRVSRAAVLAGAAACWTNHPSPQYASPPPPDGEQQPVDDRRQPDGDPQQRNAPALAESDGSPPDPKLVPEPRPDRGTILGRVVNRHTVRYPGVEVTIEGPTLGKKTKVITDKRGIFVLENIPPGNYRVTIESARLSPQDPPISTSLPVAAGTVATMAILGEVVAPVAVPVDTACCKPYGAPPARRRVV